MKKTRKTYIFNFFLFLCIFIFGSDVFANNLTISNVSLEYRNPSLDTVIVEFDASWENSWRTKVNHDAIWFTVRLYNPSVTPTNKSLCQATASGLNPNGTSVGSNSGLEIYVPSDKNGLFLRPSSYGVNSSVSSSNIRLTIDYASCGFGDNDSVYAHVLGIEMVYIPEGAFYVGDYDTSTAALDQGAADSDPWHITSESALGVSNSASNGYRYVSNGHIDEDSTGATFTIPATFPKGYGDFYAMKYEITEGQWVEFINSLPSHAARVSHDLTDTSHKNTDTVQFRNTVSCSGTPLICSSSRPARALSYLSWMDLSAFLDWAALRPMTELEFEKMARGPVLAEAGEFAWGTTNIIAATTISGSAEEGTEATTNLGANARYNNLTLTGGDANGTPEYSQGPLRLGIFATSSTTRETSGAGYYGVMELSGNQREGGVTIGNATGRGFTGSHGDGVLSIEAGYEGNADETDWPGIDGIAGRGVTGAAGSGFRGGAWDDQLSGARLRISDRYDAANASTAAYNNAGGRGVRTYEGN